METEELTKLVDGIYKNILDKFNPGARQMINAGKAYLKALHGAAAASRLYVDAITKLARQAQQGTWGGSADIGTALMRIVEVYKEIQEQQMNILKAFYVDMLVPLETNLEKDTKVVQSEQKRFLQQHKARSESYSKAAAAIKKQRKKTKTSAGNKAVMAMDKELKTMQVLEDEKSKLDAFCEQSLKNAMTQERRRYGFVLERQCSLAKHYLSYHANGTAIYQQNIEDWSEVAKTREFLPESVENMFTSRMRQVSFWPDEDVYSNPRSPQLEDDRLSITSQLRKTKSMDASCLDIRSIGDAAGSPMLSLSRAKSEYNLTASTNSLMQDCNTPQRRPKSMAVPTSQSFQWDTQLARALYAYLSSGENQLSFLEGDVIALMGERNKGWQYGENLRTQCSGWFPLAYTEIITDDAIMSPSHRSSTTTQNSGAATPATPTSGGMSSATSSNTISGNSQYNNQNQDGNHSSTRMFGDTLHLHRTLTNSKQIRRVTGANSSTYCPPPTLPAPVPTPTLPFPKSNTSTLPHSQSANLNQQSFNSPSSNGAIKSSNSTFNFSTSQSNTPLTYGAHTNRITSTSTIDRTPQISAAMAAAKKIGPAVGNVSLHSSNDSGFSNDPPPQPEVDYSDDDLTIPTTNNRVPIRSSARQKKRPENDANNNHTKTLPQSSEVPSRAGSYGTLLERNRQNGTSTQNQLMRSMRLSSTSSLEKRGIIKRTKSFWKFGKNSESEILEGMALWKHRDLVDVQRELAKRKPKMKKKEPVEETVERNGSLRSNDSDRTLQPTQPEEQVYIKTPEVIKVIENGEQLLNISDDQKSIDSDFENEFWDGTPTNVPDSFFDDDGLMLRVKTVNRKEILQLYNNDNDTESVNGSESNSTTAEEDPYDCIVVDDHTAGDTKNRKKRPKELTKKGVNKVAEIGKKLEKFAKTSRQQKEQLETTTNLVERRQSIPRTRKTSQPREHTFKTFGHDDKRRSMPETAHKENYEEDIYGETPTTDNRQIIPRTKLVKSNSVGAPIPSTESEILDYKRPPDNGHMYGPWYDLWGQDQSVHRQNSRNKAELRPAKQESIYGEKF